MFLNLSWKYYAIEPFFYLIVLIRKINMTNINKMVKMKYILS